VSQTNQRRPLEKIVRRSGIVALVAAALVTSCYFWLRTQYDGADRIDQAVVAPDGSRVAWLVSHDSFGATGEHALFVKVGSAGQIGEISNQDEVLWLGNALDLTLRWNGPRHLVVEYPSRASVERSHGSADQVMVSFVPVTTPESAWVRERAYAAWLDSTRRAKAR
jgi:hypothetical protein